MFYPHHICCRSGKEKEKRHLEGNEIFSFITKSDVFLDFKKWYYFYMSIFQKFFHNRYLFQTESSHFKSSDVLQLLFFFFFFSPYICFLSDLYPAGE